MLRLRVSSQIEQGFPLPGPPGPEGRRFVAEFPGQGGPEGGGFAGEGFILAERDFKYA